MKTYLSLLAVTVTLFSACTLKDSIPEEPIVDPETTDKDYETSIVNPDYVNIDWTSTKLQSAAPALGSYSFEKNEITENLYPGNVLTIDMDTTAYIVVVNDVNIGSDGYVYISTLDGDLCDIFANTEIVLNTEDANSTRGGFSTPDSTDITSNIINYSDSLAIEYPTLYQKGHTSVFMDKGDLKFKLDLHASYNFGGRTGYETLKNGAKRYRSNLLNMSASLKGSFDTDFRFRYVNSTENADDNGENNEEEGPELLEKGIFKGSVTVWVSNVPVCIFVTVDLYKELSLEMSGEITASVGVNTYSSLEVGATAVQSNNTVTPIFDKEFNLNITGPELTGHGSITGSASIYPRISALIYQAVGPVIDIKPYVGAEIKGGFKAAASPETDSYLAWTSRCYWGVDASASLNILWGSPLSTGFKPLIKETNIFKSPVDIEFDESVGNVAKGEKSEMKVIVYDSIFDSKKRTIFPISVKYEGDGEITPIFGFGDIGITQDGYSSAFWTPAADDSFFKASLLDDEGNEIKSVSLNSQSEEPAPEPEGTKYLSSIDDYLAMDYDDQNRIKSFKYDLGDDDAVHWNFSYDPFIVTDVTPDDGGLWSSFHLNDQGLVSDFQTQYDELAKAKVKYTSDNCLESFEGSSADGDYSNIYLEWENGNLMKITNIAYYKSESYTEKIICEFEYGDIANTHALPTLINTMVSGGMNVWQYTGLFGQTISKDLPIAIKQSYYDNNVFDDYYSYTVDYDLDENGYITKEKVGIEGYVLPLNYKYKSVGTKAVGSISRKDVQRIAKHLKHRTHILPRRH